MARYAITIFLSAFLLFQVQPLIGKFILPWFGGSPAVWTTCMLFFQVVLLLGYSYAHFITSRLSIRTQQVLHLVLLAASLGFLRIEWMAAGWKPSDPGLPILHILGLLGATIGLPYFLLSTTGPLLQESFRRETGRTPYRLYSLSNIGSLLALLSYPFVFEPQMTLHVQLVAWAAGYALFVVGAGWCAAKFSAGSSVEAADVEAAAAERAATRPPRGDIILWLSLAACGSVMLLATTNQLCQEISSIPFLWVLPLALYLLSFIICFDHERWYDRGTFLGLLASAVVMIYVVIAFGVRAPLWYQLIAFSAVLFICCMVCHGELVKARPAAEHATLFYLVVSLGGAVGGVLVAIVAPLVFPGFWEYHGGIWLTVVLAFITSFVRRKSRLNAQARLVWALFGSLALAFLMALGVNAYFESPISRERWLETSRNFYGVLHVNEMPDTGDGQGYRELIHGRTQHGTQLLDPARRRWPTTYYGPPSGIGVAIDHHPRRTADDPELRRLRIGVVGLGCGTLAAYGQKGDYLRFYEINPEVKRLSDKYFTYRQDAENAQAEVDVILGDARITLERELAEGHPQQFDVLAIDAFSSDAIPMHLLTVECVELYLKHLKPDGLLCIHISNRMLDLSGVVQGIADRLGRPCEFVDSQGDDDEGLNAATWGIITTNAAFFDDPELVEQEVFTGPTAKPIVWTDDYGSMWQVLE